MSGVDVGNFAQVMQGRTDHPDSSFLPFREVVGANRTDRSFDDFRWMSRTAWICGSSFRHGIAVCLSESEALAVGLEGRRRLLVSSTLAAL